jgi:hypothetical protein
MIRLLIGGVVLAGAAAAGSVVASGAADSSPVPGLLALALVGWAAWATGSWTRWVAGSARARVRMARRARLPVAELDADGSGDLAIEGDIAAMFEPGYAVYRHMDRAGTYLYVGKSNDLGRRTREHIRGDGKPWSDEIARVEIDRYPTKRAMDDAEVDQIAYYRPVHNVVRPRVR